jgi:hypothetical protein
MESLHAIKAFIKVLDIRNRLDKVSVKMGNKLSHP